MAKVGLVFAALVLALLFLVTPSLAFKVEDNVELDPRMDCVICQTSVFLVKELANSGFTPDQVVQNLETYFCHGNDTQKCKAMIETYVPMVINLIVKFNTSIDEVCRMFHLCPQKAQPVVEDPFRDMQDPPQPDFVKCALCQTAIFFTHDLVANNYTKEEIIGIFSKVCNLFPADVQKTCVDFTKIYVPLIILNPKFNPCPTLGWCPKP